MTELPRDAVEAVERLTRLARRAVDDAEAAAYRERRATLLDEYGFDCRVREDDAGETLVCYPAEWLVDGTVRLDRVEDTDRAVEVSLEGPGDPDDWAAVDEHNRGIAEAVRAAHGDVHGDTAAAFADFMSNHYARNVETASRRELREFVEEYFPRNAWPSDEQRDAVWQSLELVYDFAGADPPELRP